MEEAPWRPLGRAGLTLQQLELGRRVPPGRLGHRLTGAAVFLPPQTMPSISSDRAALCAGCGGKISDRYYLLAVDKQWHMRCLKCCECKLNLESELTCFSKDGSIYCKEDYYRYPTTAPPRLPGEGPTHCQASWVLALLKQRFPGTLTRNGVGGAWKKS